VIPEAGEQGRGWRRDPGNRRGLRDWIVWVTGEEGKKRVV
jgi:hypothetical protein